jgi:hypothetical protein
MGVVAVRDTYCAISKHTVSMPPRITSAVTGSTAREPERRPRLPARRTRSTLVMIAPPVESLGVEALVVAERAVH